MFKKVLLVIVLLLAILAVVVLMQPDECRVSRSMTMNAPASKVFALVNDFHHWNKWSPWAKLDPNQKSSFEGEASGVGAVMHWSGNNEVGEGSLSIIKSEPREVVMALNFTKPFKSNATTSFSLNEEAGQTQVTWDMTSRQGFVAKFFGLIFNCEKMVGAQYDKGLENIKAIVEAES